MKLFRDQKSELSEAQQALAGRLADRLLRRQRRIADWLNGRTLGWSAKLWLILLVLFCGSFGSYCLWLMLAAI